MEQEIMEPEIVDPEILEEEIVDPEIMEAEIVDPEIMEGEIVEEEKDPTLQFIEAVKEHKCIWDMQSEEYYNKDMYRAAWESLVTTLEDFMPEQPPDDSQQVLCGQQEVDIEEKVAELKKVWVELRDSYYKNEEPGKQYKDSLRFLHSVFQSREMEAVLEFDEPSWDLMDVRTWTVLKSHIPRCKRSTDPAPEYEKAKYNKKQKISTNEAKKPDKDNVTGKENRTGKENAIDKENSSCKENAAGKENASNNDNAIDIGNAANTENEPDTGNYVDTEKATDKENAAGKKKATDKDDLIGPENVTDKENATGKEKTTDKDNVTGPENVTVKVIVTVKENTTDKENATGNEKATDKDNVIDKGIATASQNISNTENSANKENATVKKTKKKKKGQRDEHQLTILEKAMRLFELDHPGVWSSDEDEAEKASRTYVDNTSQTDETDEYPNMPPVNA